MFFQESHLTILPEFFQRNPKEVSQDIFKGILEIYVVIFYSCFDKDLVVETNPVIWTEVLQVISEEFYLNFLQNYTETCPWFSAESLTKVVAEIFLRINVIYSYDLTKNSTRNSSRDTSESDPEIRVSLEILVFFRSSWEGKCKNLWLKC